MKSISHGELRRKLNKRDTIIVDVRHSSEFREGHIPHSKLIPSSSLPNKVGDLKRFKEIVLVCRSGNRSGQAAKKLMEMGFDNVRNLTGGMQSWERAGLPVEKK